MKILDYVMIIGIILMLLAGVYLLLYFKNQGISCVNDPIQYYQLTENTSCWCMNKLNIP